MNISELCKNAFDAADAVKKEIDEHEKKMVTLQANLIEAKRLYGIALKGHAVDMVMLAEEIILVRGEYTGAGDQNSVKADFVKWLATGECARYSNPKKQYLGTKNYDRFASQRSDHEYGYGPRHGSINFAIYLNPAYRDDNMDLTPQEKDACIYYLENLNSIQDAKAQSKA